MMETNIVQICSSQWSQEEQQQVDAIARSLFPDITIVNIPPGLDQREGSKGILAYLEHAFRASKIAKR